MAICGSGHWRFCDGAVGEGFLSGYPIIETYRKFLAIKRNTLEIVRRGPWHLLLVVRPHCELKRQREVPIERAKEENWATHLNRQQYDNANFVRI